MEERLDDVLITVNRNTVPYDERPPAVASGVRIGTPAATMRGLDADDAREVGSVIGTAISPTADLAALRARIGAILERRPLYAGMAHGYGAPS
jgi:glycine hydroxymethyltransferase